MDLVKEKMNIQLKPVSLLINYENNARMHSEQQIQDIVNSIQQFGFNDPIEIGADNIIISGHARLQAAIKLGLKEVPCIVHDHLNKTNRKAYILAANRIALSSSWDNNLLKEEFEELKLDEFDLSLTGFSENEIDKFMNSEFEPGLISDQGKLDMLDPILVTCPNCKIEFDTRKEK